MMFRQQTKKKREEKFELIKFYDIECLSYNASFKRSIKERERENQLMLFEHEIESGIRPMSEREIMIN